MSGKTSIEWTDKSSNPLRAYHRETGKRGWFCVHASPGCKNCYAEAMNRWVGNGLHYTAQNQKNVRFEMDAKELQSWQRLAPGTKVFPFDMTDLFHDGVPDHLIDQAFAAMATSPATFQVLTKRASRMRAYVTDWYQRTQAPLLKNVWLGVSVEDRARKERIEFLRDTMAAVRFLSIEPLLEDVGTLDLHRIGWVILGGESGPGARPFDLAWARSVIRQCRAAQVPVFLKQLGALPLVEPWRQQHWDWGGAIGRVARFTPTDPNYPASKPWRVHLSDRKGGDMSEWPEDLRVREFPEVRA